MIDEQEFDERYMLRPIIYGAFFSSGLVFGHGSEKYEWGLAGVGLFMALMFFVIAEGYFRRVALARRKRMAQLDAQRAAKEAAYKWSDKWKVVLVAFIESVGALRTKWMEQHERLREKGFEGSSEYEYFADQLEEHLRDQIPVILREVMSDVQAEAESSVQSPSSNADGASGGAQGAA